MPRLLAASISITSTVPPALISLQLAHSPHGVAVGPCTHFRQRPMMRAMVVLPVPRCPEKMYPCATRCCAMAFSRVFLTCSWLTTSAKDCGRYFLAITWYMGWGSGCRADNYARPRVIRGTRTAPLPLLPSGPGGVCGRPLHEARDLTRTYRNTRGTEPRIM